MYKSAREDQGQHSKHYGGKTIRPHLTVAETQGRTILKKQGCYEAKTQKSMKLWQWYRRISKTLWILSLLNRLIMAPVSNLTTSEASNYQFLVTPCFNTKQKWTQYDTCEKQARIDTAWSTDFETTAQLQMLYWEHGVGSTISDFISRFSKPSRQWLFSTCDEQASTSAAAGLLCRNRKGGGKISLQARTNQS